MERPQKKLTYAQKFQNEIVKLYGTKEVEFLSPELETKLFNVFEKIITTEKYWKFIIVPNYILYLCLFFAKHYGNRDADEIEERIKSIVLKVEAFNYLQNIWKEMSKNG